MVRLTTENIDKFAKKSHPGVQVGTDVFINWVLGHFGEINFTEKYFGEAILPKGYVINYTNIMNHFRI